MFLHKACGIICEYNPFHNGHKYQIEYVNKTLDMPVICAMSGSFVQRGVPACTDKLSRAKSAIAGGAEIVLEIPFPYSSMTAEKFATAGVSILDRCGMCSHIAFGSECADVKKLTAIAELLIKTDADKCIQVYQKENPRLSYAAARSLYIESALGKEFSEIASNPNDILGIEYIKAIKLTGSSLIPVAVKRTVDRCEGEKGVFASSSAVRTLVLDGKKDDAAKYVPDSATLSEISEHESFKKLIHLALMTKQPEELTGICEISGGLEYAVINAARSSESYEEMAEKLRCKTLTDAKIARMLLFSFLGVTKEMAENEVAYTFVLAKSDSAASNELMRICRKEKRITVGQRISAVRASSDARAQYEFARNAETILKLS